MSLHYDESRPSPLQRQYAAQRRDARVRMGCYVKPQLATPQPVPMVREPTEYWPPTYWRVDSAWNIQIPAIEASSTGTPKAMTPDMIYSIRDIQDAVCRAAKLGRNDLISARRSYNIVNPRHVAVALCRVFTCDSLVGIGKQFNGKDHSTVSNSINKMEPVIEKMKWMFEVCTLAHIVEVALQESRRLYPPMVSRCGARRDR